MSSTDTDDGVTHQKCSHLSPITTLVSFSNKGSLLALASLTTGLGSHKVQKWSKS
jgi:hypothetical protein